MRSLFPGRTDLEIGELVADYFNSISDEFLPLRAFQGPQHAPYNPLTVPEVEKRIKDAKKSKSSVKGDILPELVNDLAPILAVPLCQIYNNVLNSSHWPHRWKLETVTIIPKKPCPTGLTDCRNLSCTALFSKILETYVLGELRKKTGLEECQYGGSPGCGVDQFLIDSWQNILDTLEDTRASVNIVSLDFEKAFNRVDHAECLRALSDHGASDRMVGVIRSFLTGRKMSVKIGSTLSVPRDVNGGSPQGSILGTYLFNITTDRLTSGIEYGDDGVDMNMRLERGHESPEIDLSLIHI